MCIGPIGATLNSMKKATLYFLLVLYLAFVSIDFLTVSRIVLGAPTIIFKLIFSFGCVIWIHIDRTDVLDKVDFDLIRLFLIFMAITDFILAVPSKFEGAIGRAFFTMGILSAAFGQCVLVLRHLGLSRLARAKRAGAVSLNVSRKVQIYCLAIFFLVETSLLVIGLASGSLVSLPFVAFYIFISCVSLASSFSYLRSANQMRSRLLAFMGVSLLFISDSLLGLGLSPLKDWPYLDMVVWATYAPVLLLIGSSILRLEPANST
jgi:hypothetical protein